MKEAPTKARLVRAAYRRSDRRMPRCRAAAAVWIPAAAAAAMATRQELQPSFQFMFAYRYSICVITYKHVVTLMRRLFPRCDTGASPSFAAHYARLAAVDLGERGSAPLGGGRHSTIVVFLGENSASQVPMCAVAA